MHHELPLLINIGAALTVALIGGFIARRLGLPTIVGYLLAGVAIGPFTPGFVGDIDNIRQLAELGVIFLMFGVGLHFSLHDLWEVRDIAIPGSLARMVLVSALGFGLAQLWGWPVSSALVLGLAISIASTVVLLRGLTDTGLLDTRHGRAAIGSVVLEDLATIAILVSLPVIGSSGGEAIWQAVGLALLKASAFIGLMLFAGTRIVPWILRHIVHTRSRELFILLILVIALGTALGSAEMFQVSLALGAFIAGIVVSESPFSHQVGADLLPFREAFAVLFFVSVGMLVNPTYLWQNGGQVLALSAVIVLGKALIAALIGFLFPHPARTALVLGAGLSQIGEFSFIVGTAGLAQRLLSLEQYSLILAGALLSITINPLMYRLITPVERLLKGMPVVWRVLNRHGPAPVPIRENLADHVVLVGYGRVGHHIVDVLEFLKIPRLVVEMEPHRLAELQRKAVPTLFGDAANSELLRHANLNRARALVVTVPDEASTGMIVAAARQLASDLPIIVRAATQDGIERLAALGASDVIHPELEGGLEIVRHTLLRLDLPLSQVQRYTDAVRRENYHTPIDSAEEHRILSQLVEATERLEITWFPVEEDNVLVAQSLAEANIRAHTGASVIAVAREGSIMPNPKSSTVFAAGDRVGLIGEPEQISAAEAMFFSRSSPQALRIHSTDDSLA